MSAEPRWFFQTPGGTHGPIPLDDLRARIAAGAIPPETLVWYDGAPQSVPASWLIEEWNVSQDDRTTEGVCLYEIHQALAEGQLHPEAVAWRPGDANSRTLATLFGMAPAPQTPQVPAASPQPKLASSQPAAPADSPLGEGPWDLFISYARKDNQPARPGEAGWVTAFIEALQAEHRRATGGHELRVFFDKEDIRPSDNWEWRIGRGLRESKLLLAFLSPNYFKSEWCRREWEAWVEHEIARHVLSEGITPVYFVEVPGFPDAADQENAAWMGNYRRRQHFDLHPFVPQGVEALRHEALRARLAELERLIRERTERVDRAAASPNTVPDYNPCFVGRLRELDALFEMLSLRRMGVVAAVHGLGGMGKTELSFTYAHAFAHEYPGGRYLLRCEGRDDLRAVLCDLAPDIGVEFTDDEKKSLDLSFPKIRAGLARWGREKGRVLLVLDNVDRRELLSKQQTDLLNLGQDIVHLLGTTRLEPPPAAQRSGVRAAAHETTAWLAIDELPPDDAVRLIEKHRPFTDASERAAARQIAADLGGFALAIETIAVHLANEPNLSCKAMLEDIRANVLPVLDVLGADASVELRRHNHEKLLGRLIRPTLDRLTPPERLAVEFAALLPPDQVVIPWLRALVAKTFPELGAALGPGRPDPWHDGVVRRLAGLRLLPSVVDVDPDRRPRVMRMHRLVQKVVAEPPDENAATDPALASKWDARIGAIEQLVHGRLGFLEKGWLDWDNRWEVEPLAALATHWLDQGRTTAPPIANRVMVRLDAMARLTEAEPLVRQALQVGERVLGPEHPSTLDSVNNLAALLESKGDYAGALPLYQRALEASERVLGPEHPDTLASVNNLAFVLSSKGDYAGALPLYQRALEARERVLGPEHPDTLASVNNLAALLSSKGDYAGALPLYQRALEASERVLGPEHPDTLASVQALADVLEKTGRAADARPLRLRALAAVARKPDATPLQLRTAALDSYKLGDSAQAIALLERVLARGFEIPGTHCHLARIGLLTDRFDDAREHAREAWEHRAEAPPYVVPRILWLQLACDLLTNPHSEIRNPTSAILLGRLKTALQAEGAHMEWSMGPVLEHLRANLTPDAHALLAALVAALSDVKNLPALDAFPAWRDATPRGLN